MYVTYCQINTMCQLFKRPMWHCMVRCVTYCLHRLTQRLNCLSPMWHCMVRCVTYCLHRLTQRLNCLSPMWHCMVRCVTYCLHRLTQLTSQLFKSYVTLYGYVCHLLSSQINTINVSTSKVLWHCMVRCVTYCLHRLTQLTSQLFKSYVTLYG